MQAEEIARALGGKRSGRQWLCKCPAHNDGNPSLIVFDGHTDVQVRCYAGCEPVDVIAALSDRGLWRKDGARIRSAQVNVARETNSKDSTAVSHRELALAIWQEGVHPLGTLAEKYLLGRGLALPEAIAGRCARYHGSCPRGRERVPALVVVMRDFLTDDAVAIQRIYLTKDGVKDGKPMMLGSVANAAMMLSDKRETFSQDLLYCPRLYVGEGFETCLAMYLNGFKPTWALGSAGAILRFPVMWGVGTLTICADNDPVGVASAEACAKRWVDARLKAFIWVPNEEGRDFADAAETTS